MRTAILLSFCLAVAAPAFAAEPAAAPSWPQRSYFEIEMQDTDVVAYARADDAVVAGIAARLETVLQVPVTVSDALSRTRVSFPEMTGVPLGAVLLRIAPAVHVDVRESATTGPTLLAVHLGEEGWSPRRPQSGGIGGVRLSADRRGGDTTPETAAGPVPDEGPFLRVRLDADGKLDIDARDQGLGVLLFDVAQAYGARLDFRIPEAPIVDRIEVSGIVPSELPALLGLAEVGVEIRRNLATQDELLLRCFVD